MLDALLGRIRQPDHREWLNDDCDTGDEVMFSVAVPLAAASCFRVEGVAWKGAVAKGFLGLLCVTYVDNGVGYDPTVAVSAAVPVSTSVGDASDVSWPDGISDYDAATGTVRFKTRFASDGWAASGNWQRIS